MTDVDKIQPMLRFRDGDSVIYECHWTGDWPPPAEFLVLVGTESGIVRVWPIESPVTPELQKAIDLDTIQKRTFTLANFSQLSDDDMAYMNDGAVRVMRGAEYLPA